MLTDAAPAVDFLNRAAELHDCSGVYAMFSGGDDSLTAALIASHARRFRGCVHLDTGIGIPETQAFVRETCRVKGWPLFVYSAKNCGQDYDQLAIRYGFPGPGAHFRMYSRLKERPLRQFIREHKRTRADHLLLSTGARSQESARRMGHVQPLRQAGASIWANPIHAWSKSDCLEYIAASGVPRNPVVELLHMSGECLCGCFAHENELAEIALWFPSVAARIRDLETRVRRTNNPSEWGRTKMPRKLGGKVSELCQRCELREQS